MFSGGSSGNAQLTSIAASVLLVLLAAEGATLLDLRSLLTVHAFVGVLLIPPVALKLSSTGWRMFRYYRRAEEYVLHGPPHLALRVLIAPVLIVSTIALFGTGIALLALGRTQGAVVTLHQASFIVWVGSIGVHVLAHLVAFVRALVLRAPGLGVRLACAGTAVCLGLVAATLTFPAADHLQDSATSHVVFYDH